MNRQDGKVMEPGQVSAKLAKEHAESEFQKYRLLEDKTFESDFDRVSAEAEAEEGLEPDKRAERYNELVDLLRAIVSN